MNKIWVSSAAIYLAGLSNNLFAGEQGHYFPGVMNIRDIAQPPPGIYFANYAFHYHADTFNLSSGDELDEINVVGSVSKSINVGRRSILLTVSGTLEADINVDLDMTIDQPTLIWITDYKLLGANYGIIVGQPFGSMKVKVKADLSGAGTITLGPVSRSIPAKGQIEIEDKKTGLADTMVTPFWLGWHGREYDAGVSYTFYAPTGAYDNEDLANTGMGFWTHQLQTSLVYYPLIIQPKATALTVIATYELHSNKEDEDVRPGDNFTLEYGISQYLATWFEIGAFGYHQWQVTDDKGEDATSTTHDQNNGAGAQIGVWPVKDKFYLSGRFAWEYGSEDRFAGWLATMSALYIF